ncbi:vacuolar protein [Cryptococcus gattii E566]|uniref:Vacuolar protein, putative n=2 Tax=Cryptococcus gattii TaxID=37769 RepID=E6R4K8_CRYGW|nr:Vacuolar protein, putative [Cryptococcus gattii WM276]ADV22002.1 Vacuolar protein, putative [Cryptococcus gattii WM276]KIR80416.1 vacuolar protein [Cryptococcus gattii EJB2]KIY33460.1 vacuolar protein [Cryptococcus gattii E566]KJE00417.1 vacuolar protein [Cryptococcus gattii NT-10]
MRFPLLPLAALELPVPTAHLEWKQANFLSISDSHGWLLGHQHSTWPEPNYSGDYGSFASFVIHMREIADEKGVDLLLVDAGDHHDGSGLVSSSPDSASLAEDIFSMIQYDVITIGNHELYHYADALDIYENQERWGGRYVTSNVNITVEREGEWQSVPIGQTHLKFTTKQGYNVTAFGVIFNFKAHDKGITVQKPSKLARESWFREAIRDAPDYFILSGHMPVRGEIAEFAPVFNAIRDIHPKVPIYIFGGHTHVRDCVQYDERSIGVIPGKYLETVAFTSSSLPSSGGDDRPLDVARSYKWHTNQTSDTFDTKEGRRISLSLQHLASSLNITESLGVSPHNYYLSRHPWGHPRSVLTLFSDKVLPSTVVDHEGGKDQERIIIGNAGSLRFDLFQGVFDRNDELTVSPFTSAFLYTRLPASLARNITDQMNRAGASKLMSKSPMTPYEEEQRVKRIHDKWMYEQWQAYEREIAQEGDTQKVMVDKGKDKPRTLGHVTRDKCPGTGDDIAHIPVPFYPDQPDFISTPFPSVAEDEEIDVVCMDFALDDFLTAVNTLDPARNLEEGMMKPYAKGLRINTVFGKYAQRYWRAGTQE